MYMEYSTHSIICKFHSLWVEVLLYFWTKTELLDTSFRVMKGFTWSSYIALLLYDSFHFILRTVLLKVLNELLCMSCESLVLCCMNITMFELVHVRRCITWYQPQKNCWIKFRCIMCYIILHMKLWFQKIVGILAKCVDAFYSMFCQIWNETVSERKVVSEYGGNRLLTLVTFY